MGHGTCSLQNQLLYVPGGNEEREFSPFMMGTSSLKGRSWLLQQLADQSGFLCGSRLKARLALQTCIGSHCVAIETLCGVEGDERNHTVNYQSRWLVI